MGGYSGWNRSIRISYFRNKAPIIHKNIVAISFIASIPFVTNMLQIGVVSKRSCRQRVLGIRCFFLINRYSRHRAWLFPHPPTNLKMIIYIFGCTYFTYFPVVGHYMIWVLITSFICSNQLTFLWIRFLELYKIECIWGCVWLCCGILNAKGVCMEIKHDFNLQTIELKLSEHIWR